MPLDAQSDVPAPPRGFTLDTASPSLPPAQTDDGIPTVTVRPQGAKKPNAGNEGGEPILQPVLSWIVSRTLKARLHPRNLTGLCLDFPYRPRLRTRRRS